MAARLIRTLAACVLAVSSSPASATADGDPASDVLLGENVFYPYSPPVSTSLQGTLNAETAAAARAHFPIKVALIASPTDLGVVPDLFDQPQKYADFLDQEISFQTKQPLLVVMPSGYGIQGLTRPATAAAASLTKPTGNQKQPCPHSPPPQATPSTMSPIHQTRGPATVPRRCSSNPRTRGDRHSSSAHRAAKTARTSRVTNAACPT